VRYLKNQEMLHFKGKFQDKISFYKKLHFKKHSLLKHPTSTNVFFYKELLKFFNPNEIGREYVIFGCIIDFIFLYKGLIIEIDDSKTQNSKKFLNDAFFKSQGLDILRFSSNDILTKFDSIIDYIKMWRSLDNSLEVKQQTIKTIRKLNRIYKSK
jgi:very-short-patch-repair endonuclease